MQKDMNSTHKDLIMQHLPQLNKYCAALCNHHKQNTEDLVQNTICKVFSSGLKHAENVRGLLFRIAKNERINHYRWNHFCDDSEPHLKDLATMECYDANLHDLEAYNRMIIQLNPLYSKALQLYMDGFQYKEIAELQKVNINTVKSRIFLARKILGRTINE